MLRFHREDTTFLNVPVIEQLAVAEQSLAFLASPANWDHWAVWSPDMSARAVSITSHPPRSPHIRRVILLICLLGLLRALVASLIGLRDGGIVPDQSRSPRSVIGAVLSYVSVCPLRLSVTLAAPTANAVPEVVTSVASV